VPPGGGVAPESAPPDKRLSVRTLGPAGGGGVRRGACRLLEEEYAGERAAASQHRSVRRGVDIGVPPGKRLKCADTGGLREEEYAGERAAC